MNADSFENWLLAMLVRGGVIGVMWYAIGMAVGRASADRLSMWWRCGALALLVVVFFPWSAVRWSIPVNRPAPVLVTNAALDPLPISVVAIPAAPKATIRQAGPVLSGWAWVWAFGSTVLLARLLASHWRVRRLIQAAKPVSLLRIKDVLAEECIRAGFRRPVALKSHADVKAPFVAGWFRPVIVFPADSSAHKDDELRLMLRHEVAHLLRSDLAWQLLVELTAALHWPNPFVWILRGRLRLAHEANADDFVLAGGTDGSTYATLLFGIAGKKDHSADEPCLAAMARVSTLRARIGLILDANRRRNTLRPIMRWTLMAGSCLAAMIFGFTGLRAQVAAPGSPAIPTDQSWSRSYRDTFHLENSFSERFAGPSDEALAAFQKELVTAGVPLENSIKFELSPDKTTLKVEFSEVDRPIVERKFAQAIVRAGWWRDAMELQKKAVDDRLSAVRDELQAQRKQVEAAAREMAKLREAARIIDADPERSDAMISVPNPEWSQLEQTVREKALRVSDIQAQFDLIRRMGPGEIRTALRILNIQDTQTEKLESALQDVIVKDVGLEASGLSENHPERSALRAQKAKFLETLDNAMISIQQSQAALLEIERRTLEDLRSRFEKAQKQVVEDKQRVTEYASAKARYLNEKKIFEAGQLKFSTERIDLMLNQPMPSAR